MNKVNTSQAEYLIEKHKLLVYKIARRFKTNATDFDDLVQAGMMGLFTAIRRYDITKGTKLSTFATYFIIGSIKDELRKQCLNCCSPYELREDLNNVRSNYLTLAMFDFNKTERLILELRLKYHLSQSEIAKKLGISQSTISRILKTIQSKISY